MQMLNAALMIATKAHDGQFDKGKKPYMFHVLAVMHKLRSDDEELNCIALLHDVVEDTKTTYQELREAGMTERVIAAVRLLTKVPGQTNEEYLEGILSSRDAMLVKKSDLQHNMDLRRLKGVTQKDLERMNKYTLMYHAIDQKLKEPVQAVKDETFGFKPGDTCQFKHAPRNVYGELDVEFSEWKNYRFVLDEIDHNLTLSDEHNWVAFDIKSPNGDSNEDNLFNKTTLKYDAWRSWVRSDDIELA